MRVNCFCSVPEYSFPMDKALMLTLIHRAIHEIVFYHIPGRLWYFNYFLFNACLHEMSEKCRKRALVSFAIVGTSYRKEYAHCSSGLGRLDLVEEGRSRDGPCLALPQYSGLYLCFSPLSSVFILKHCKYSEDDGCEGSDVCVCGEAAIHKQSPW